MGHLNLSEQGFGRFWWLHEHRLRAHRHLLAPIKPKELGGLFSFHYFKDASMVEFLGRLKESGYQPEVFTDSGGFSAFSQGITIDFDDYARWLLRWRNVIDHYANLDVIGDAKASLRNLLRLEQRGLRPLPVIHVGTDPEEIRRYKARGYSYLCLGGMVPHLGGVASALRGEQEEGIQAEKKALEWMRDCHAIAAEEGVLLHGFGATNAIVMRNFPWRSVDSSTWAVGFRFGCVWAFCPVTGRWIKFLLRDIQGIMRQAALIRFYGVDPLSLVKDGKDSRQMMITLTVRSYMVAIRQFRLSGLYQPNLQIYLADSTAKAGDGRIYSQILSHAPTWAD